MHAKRYERKKTTYELEIGTAMNKETIVEEMLFNKDAWMKVSRYIEDILTIKEGDERARRAAT